VASKKYAATFVIPCLNEANSIGALLEEANNVFKQDQETEWDILVSDNGSSDNSVQIAKRLGAKVAHASKKGYGSAVHSGIINASTPWVIYADADGTYCPKDAVRLLKAAIKQSADLAMGSRLKGTVKAQAMPFLHRYLGTPVLSLLIRILYGVEITDCNSGIRCINKESYLKWKIKSKGMEFASALIIKAANAEANIIEIPVTLRRSKNDRVPHLKKWRDGMRHLLVVLAGAPWLFWKLGVILIFLSSLFAIPSLWGERVVFGTFSIFGPHTLAISTVIGFYGTLCFNLSLLIYATSPTKRPPPQLIKWLLEIPEGLLFWFLTGFTGLFVTATLFLLYKWYQVDFGGLNFVQFALFFMYMTVIPTGLVMGIFQAHLEKRVDI